MTKSLPAKGGFFPPRAPLEGEALGCTFPLIGEGIEAQKPPPRASGAGVFFQFQRTSPPLPV